jgi:hypothetical protein
MSYFIKIKVVAMSSLKTIIFIIIIGSASQGFAQTNSITITNADNKTTTFSLDDMRSFPQTILNVEGEDGVNHNYSGVDLYTLLSKAGVSFGKDVRRQTLTSYMLIKAADNYSVVYALTEVDSFFSSKKIILAFLKDDQPLTPNFGPLQIIATGEKKHARLIRQVTEIDIRKVQ